MTALPNCIRCIDKSKSPIPPCKYAASPLPHSVLTSKDMVILGYCSCLKSGKNYLANADRFRDCGYDSLKSTDL